MGQSQLALPFTEEQKQRAKTFAEKVLDLLLSKPFVTRDELVAIHDRFSASIHVLRKMGHEIVIGQADDGSDLYSWLRCTAMVEVTEEMQQRYYDSTHWADTRTQRLEFDNWQCCHCHRTDDLQVHHWHYDLFAEQLEDLMTLCQTCHTAIHENANVTVHFPRYVTPEIAKLLGVTK